MRKKPIIIIGGIVIALSLLIIFAFDFKKELTPSETISAFHQLAKSGEVEKSKQYISNDILQGFENGHFWYYGSYGNFITDYNKDTKSVIPIKKTEKINGETSSVDVKILYKNDTEGTDTYHLIKENKTWKIAE